MRGLFMGAKTKFIILDSPDNCGKSTFIQDLLFHYDRVQEIKFKKTLPSGELLRINTEKDFELLFSMFELLDKRKTYILDRFIVSNLVYDKIFRNASPEYLALSKKYYEELKSRFDVLEIFLSREKITEDFVDDRISIPKDKFNAIIDEYHEYGPAWFLLDRHDGKTVLNEHVHHQLMAKCNSFIHK